MSGARSVSKRIKHESGQGRPPGDPRDPRRIENVHWSRSYSIRQGEGAAGPEATGRGTSGTEPQQRKGH